MRARTLRWVGGLATAALLTVACGFAEPPSGWVFPTPAARAGVAEVVAIDVAPVPADVGADVQFACPSALLAPVELVVDRSVSPHSVGYRIVGTGEPLRLTWSWGVSAYELDGIVRIVSPTGDEVMTEGKVTDDLGGGAGDVPGSFSVCLLVSLPQRVGGEPLR